MINYRIHEITVDTGVVDVSDTSVNPEGNKCFKHFKDILALNLAVTGWEVDSNGKRLGLFFHNRESIEKMVEFLKIRESDIEMLGVFYDSRGIQTIRIIKKYVSGDEFDNCGINWLAYNYDKPTEMSYELRATLDVRKFISDEEIEKLKTKFPKDSKFSHIKVKNGKLTKVYFIEYYTL